MSRPPCELGGPSRPPIYSKAGRPTTSATMRTSAAGETGFVTWAVKPALKARISQWNRVNVVQPQEVALLAAADVIFCRNLFIYFNETTVRAVAEQFADCMRTPGFLCVGAAESLLRVTTRFELQDIGGAYVYVRS